MKMRKAMITGRLASDPMGSSTPEPRMSVVTASPPGTVDGGDIGHGQSLFEGIGRPGASYLVQPGGGDEQCALPNAPHQPQGEHPVPLHCGNVGETGQRDAGGEGDPVDDKE